MILFEIFLSKAFFFRALYCFYSVLSVFVSFCHTLVPNHFKFWMYRNKNNVLFSFIITPSLDIDFEQVISPGWDPTKQRLKTSSFNMLESSKKTIVLHSLFIIFAGYQALTLAKTNLTTDIFLGFYGCSCSDLFSMLASKLKLARIHMLKLTIKTLEQGVKYVQS